MKARYTTLQASGNSFNFLPYVEDFKYSDSIESEADTVEMTLCDNERKNLAKLIPARGTEFQFAIVQNDFDGAQTLNLGTFELDKIRYAGPPTQIKLYFNSLPNKSGARGIENNTAWEDTTLQKIASDIAGRTGLNLVYEVSNDPEIKRAEQSGESDFAFLEKLCRKNSLNMKVHNKQLIIFDAEEYEQRASVLTLTPNSEITHFEFNANSADIYSGAEVNFLPNGISDIAGGIASFLGGEIGGLLNSFTGENGGGNLNINERVHSKAEAENLSKGKVREKNKNEFKASFDLAGNTKILAGVCFNVAEFGNVFDGKYICDRTEHSLSNGYTTRVQAHKVL